MTQNRPTRVGIVGASGYAGEELVRLLLGHPRVELSLVTSRQYAGKTLGEIFPRFAHHPRAQALKFVEPELSRTREQSDIVFLALPHGVSAEIGGSLVDTGSRVIDLSADFRLRDASVYKEFYGQEHARPDLLAGAVYGLPEIYRREIVEAKLVACPGCYPTSILLPLLPLVRSGLVDADRILVASLSGVTGAGRKVEPDYLFAECNESMRPYGVPKHRHLSEIEQELAKVAGRKMAVQFTPHLVPLNRGIVSTIYCDLVGPPDDEAISVLFREAYGSEPFVRLLGRKQLPDTKNVALTNFIDIGWRIDPRTRRLVVMSAIDNLTRGTSGQAVQCLNLMRGYAEREGLA